ncbi:MAG: cell division protein FtsH [Rubripirellula sp.]
MNQDPSKPPIPDDQDSSLLTATAFHEAGHAVMAMSLGRLVQKVTIVPGKSQFGDVRLGVCELKKGRSKASKNTLEDEVLILFAGMVAEAHFTGQYCRQGASQDLRTIHRLLASRSVNEGSNERLQRRLLNKTEHQLQDPGHAKAIELIARELIARTTISGRAVRHHFDQATKEDS